MFVMFFNVVFSMFVCYSAAFCQLCFYNKDWIGLDWMKHCASKVSTTGQDASKDRAHLSATVLLDNVTISDSCSPIDRMSLQ